MKEELRKGNEIMQTDIACLKKDVEYIKFTLEEMKQSTKEVKSILLSTELVKRNDLEFHTRECRVIYGIIISLVLAIIGKLIHG